MAAALVFNAFEIIGIVSSFDINLDELETKYILLCKKSHPDVFVTGCSPLDMGIVNQAYGILKSDVERANHLMSIHNVDPCMYCDMENAFFILESGDLKLLNSEIDLCRQKFAKFFECGDYKSASEVLFIWKFFVKQSKKQK